MSDENLNISIRFFCLDMNSTRKLFGLRKYCHTYGKMSECLMLKDDKQFEDWHLRVKLDDHEVKILCCPEDVMCSRLGEDEHSSAECCSHCSAPFFK